MSSSTTASSSATSTVSSPVRTASLTLVSALGSGMTLKLLTLMLILELFESLTVLGVSMGVIAEVTHYFIVVGSREGDGVRALAGVSA